MKRAAIAAIFLIVMLVSCFFALRRLENGTAEMRGEIAQMGVFAKGDDSDGLTKAFERLKAAWDKEKTVFHAISGSEESDGINSALDIIPVYISQNKRSELLFELSELDSKLASILETQALTALNLF